MSEYERAGEPVDLPEDPSLAPVTVGERISSLDFIRGIAVMGILGANIIAFGQPILATMYPPAWLSPENDPDHYWWLAQFVLIDGKMRGLFSILFGAGLWLFLQKAEQRGAGQGLAIRRLAFLGLFGLIHYYFIWVGDILFLYSVSGLVLLGFLQIKPFNQLILGALAFVVSSILFAVIFGGLYYVSASGMDDSGELANVGKVMLESGSGMDAAIATGDYLAFVGHQFTVGLFNPLSALFQSTVETAGLMLIGMALMRMGFFEGLFDRRKMIVWGSTALILGTAASVWLGLWLIDQDFDIWASSLAYIGASNIPRLAMALGMAALLVVFAPGATGWLGSRISAAGRAAFTNYLGTSILMLFVFHGWALGLFGELSRPQLYLVAAIAWIVMLAWSKPWLDRYRYGPLEWLWRCLTYGKRFPLRRA